MIKQTPKKSIRMKKHWRSRNKIKGTPERPRLAVFRSTQHIYAQIIDDTVGKTLVAASTLEVKVDGTKTDAARAVGAAVAKKALENGIEKVVFDRGGNLYHGRIQALAEGAREAGLDF
ncbi:MAG: 50S ribosomal protein L18 [Agathobacter sp.]|nr:50S ribosomal protein L18 [Peptococcaceae bacterium]MBR2046904.1 50S ribosomal protein L18 [Agathobacter sp.]MBO5114577.1 50S ribosomal protein L18 [Peptococcaceae bacterium]MBO5141202.1 50S ribosomal protein L18 [Peptococcaceae bacterium]MBO5365125.1 50S ribosomal protein L18 [Peptococcaceae bacterium]